MRAAIVLWSLASGATCVFLAAGGCVGNSPGDCASHGSCSSDASDADGSEADSSQADRGQGDAAERDAGSMESAAGREASPDGMSEGGGSRNDAVVCDPTKSPHDDPCVIDNAYGVFVSASGRDGATGTMADPLRTLGQGIAAALQRSGRVYVCQGTYTEQVVLDAQHDAVSLYGGLDCAAGWRWTGNPSQAQASGERFALRVDATTKPVVVEDMAFSVQDATGPDDAGVGQSSIAAFVSHESAGLTLRRVVLSAGNGADGASGRGPPPTNWYSPDAGDLQGNAPDGGTGGVAKDCKCQVWGDTAGGAGGNAGDLAGDGGPGVASPPANPQGLSDGTGGAGYPAGTLGSCVGGREGANGQSRALAADAGPVAPGVLSLGGWSPSAGADGLAGNPGQGGGGGGGGRTGGGGGGGCGGCGGAGGLGGAGGGGSIALLVLDAVLDVQETMFVTRRAGNGGNGSAGENGSAAGVGNVGACGGGGGGNGAGGQGGGGGAGGISVTVLSSAASRITIDSASKLSTGQAGLGGTPGDGGAAGGSQAADGMLGIKGPDGVSQAQLSL
jgi:hypothetical protein